MYKKWCNKHAGVFTHLSRQPCRGLWTKVKLTVRNALLPLAASAGAGWCPRQTLHSSLRMGTTHGS